MHVAPGSYPGGFKTTAKALPRRAYLSTLRWGAKIVPPLDSANTSAWDNRGNYVDIIGFDVDGTVYQGGVKNAPGKVANNIAYRVAEAGILLWRDATNVVVANNTVAASNSGIVIGAGDYYYSSGPNDEPAGIDIGAYQH